MTTDEIIKLARAAKLPKFMHDTEDCREGLERFAALVAAAERKECADIVMNAGFRSNGTPSYEHIAEKILKRHKP